MLQQAIYLFVQHLRARAAITGVLVLLVASTADALPQGGVLNGGSATISTSGSLTTINQSASRAIIDWSSFNIGVGETVQFNQLSSSSIALNRIHDSSPSTINGNLNANGQVWLVNQQGIMFGSGAQVNVAGLLATSSDIANSDFMSGNYNFTPGSNPNATISNAGLINITTTVPGANNEYYFNNGLAALVGPNVSNSGTIVANYGKVQLASGDSFTIDLAGDGLINIQASPAIVLQLVENSGSITANGGKVLMTAAAAQNALSSLVNVEGVIQADRINNRGGVITLSGSTVENTGTVTSNTGTININAKNIGQQGILEADGGSINETFSGAYIDNAASQTTAANIALTGSSGSSIFASGSYDASFATLSGGSIAMIADQVYLYAATLNASGALSGGNINIGGGTVVVNPYTTLTANGQYGGSIIVNSTIQTAFAGTATAHGKGSSITPGNKFGLRIVRPPGTIYIGSQGQNNLDPTHLSANNIGWSQGTTLINSGQYSTYFPLIDPNVNMQDDFGFYAATLANVNIVVPDAEDSFSASYAGAVYLFNETTGALISTLRGSNPNDQIGESITPLTNGNFVIGSPYWNNNTGAATWANGTTGVSGIVSAANSLVGSNSGDQVSSGIVNGIVALANGNYVVDSPEWNGEYDGYGAVTWGNGTTGTVGIVSPANSLVGTQPGDVVGFNGVTALPDGNYLIISPGNVGGAGAVTWANGTTGISGTISSSNSLIDNSIGRGNGEDIVILPNGNYVIVSPYWWDANTTNYEEGAVTWGNSATGITGQISAANSLVGSTAYDQVGFFGVIPLPNSNYLVLSPYWKNGNYTDGDDMYTGYGAVTWGNGTTGTRGIVSASNSLVGSNPNDTVGYGGVTVLTNGNYVINSPFWNNGGDNFSGYGAVTWANGNTVITGTISVANSLVGSNPGDLVGYGGVAALTNGNYVIDSYGWNNGGIFANSYGAVTWANGKTGITGTISAANSLVGSNPGDLVGFDYVTALPNGNYVISSSSWSNFTGAVTWANGDTGITGFISAANSLVGSQSGDNVGYGYLTVLPNGNYLTDSPFWNNGSGSVSWANGNTGISGTISAANSLIGNPGDYVGIDGITVLTNSNYVVSSHYWGDGSGAVTWGNGAGGTNGVVSATNSLVGNPGDVVGFGLIASAVTPLANGNYVVTSPGWGISLSGETNNGAITWGNGTTGTSGLVSPSNSLIGAQSNGELGIGGIEALANGNYIIYDPFWNNGAGRIILGNGNAATGAPLRVPYTVLPLSSPLPIVSATPASNVNQNTSLPGNIPGIGSNITDIIESINSSISALTSNKRAEAYY